MTRETKVGLLLGMGLVLLIGIIISDHLAEVQRQTPARLTDFANQAQESLVDNPLLRPNETGFTQHEPADFVNSAKKMPQPHRRKRKHPAPAPSQNFTTPFSAVDLPRAWELAHPPLPPNRAVTVELTGNRSANTSLSAKNQGNRLEDPQQVSEPALPPDRTESIHYVQEGENLSTIARMHYGDGTYWPILAEVNKDQLIKNNQVSEGTRLIIPKRSDELFNTEWISSKQAVGVNQTPLKRQRGGPITVKSGDTLSSLASVHLGNSMKWKHLLQANQDRLDRPEELQVGMTLRLPGSAPVNASAPKLAKAKQANSSYTVRTGDTLYEIAQQELGDGHRWHELFEANRQTLKNPNALRVGQRLQIPL